MSDGDQPNGLLYSYASVMALPLGLLLIGKILTIAIAIVIPFWVEFVVLFAEEHIQLDSTDSRHTQLQSSVVMGSFAVFFLRMVVYFIKRCVCVFTD